MSTRSNVGVIHKDGSVKTAYCHFDGYADGVGATLLKHYNSEKAANAVIRNGSMSALAGRKLIDPPAGAHHEWEYSKAHPDTVIYYHRDRGESWDDVQPRSYIDLAHFLNEAYEDWTEYAYLWDCEAGKWRAWTIGFRDSRWIEEEKRVEYGPIKIRHKEFDLPEALKAIAEEEAKRKEAAV